MTISPLGRVAEITPGSLFLSLSPPPPRARRNACGAVE